MTCLMSKSPVVQLEVVLLVGGVALGVVTVPAPAACRCVPRSCVRRSPRRVALSCAVPPSVRACLVDHIAGQLSSLRARLMAAATAVAQGSTTVQPWEHLPMLSRTPGLASALSRTLPADTYSVALGQRTGRAIGTSASRRAMLPAAAVHELLEAAAVAGEPVTYVPLQSEQPKRVVYAPDLIQRPWQHALTSAAGRHRYRTMRPINTAVYDRRHFETLFATPLRSLAVHQPIRADEVRADFGVASTHPDPARPRAGLCGRPLHGAACASCR